MRLTAIWAETQLDLLDHPPPAEAPFVFLGRDYTYEAQIQTLLDGGAAPGRLTLPWRKLDKQFFWSYYLKFGDTDEIKARRMWRALVPLRGKLPLVVEAPWLPSPGRLFWEAYYYPHGIAYVFTAVLRGEMTLDEAVALAYAARRDERYRVQAGTGGVESLSLDELAEKGLAIARRNALGPNAGPGRTPSQPFTVATVVRADGVVPTVETPNGGIVHCALEALTSWQPDYASVQPPDLAGIELETRNAPAGHVLYRHRRSRAVWYPDAFGGRDPEKHSLACYHRNLVLVSLQVESLGGLIAETARSLVHDPVRYTRLKPCARFAAGALGRLYGGTDTYRSHSPRAQIEQNDLLPALQAVRDQFPNMEPLS